MLPEAAQADNQLRTLRTYTILHHLRSDWGGALIVASGLGPEGAALALASNVAGAVCLSIESDPALLKEALRTAACDFVVNTLDEALRAMKNEVRKQLPLSVGLEADPATILTELIARGVAPQLVTDLTATPNIAALRDLQSQGAVVLNLGNLHSIPDAVDAPTLLAAFLEDRHWAIHDFPLQDKAAQTAFDAGAATLLPQQDTIRRSWLSAARRLFPRERPPHRVLWLTELERELLQKSVQTDTARQ